MNKNKIILYTLMLGLFYIYVTYNQSKIGKQQTNVTQQKTDNITLDDITNIDNYAITTSTKNNNVQKTLVNTTFSPFMVGTNTSSVIENKYIKVTCENKGGKIKNVVLKGINNYTGNNVTLFDGFDLGFVFQCNGQSINTNNLFFSIDKANTNDKHITYLIDIGNGKQFKQTYNIDENYEISHEWEFVNSNQYISDNKLMYIVNGTIYRQENDRDTCKSKTTINYFTTDGKFDGLDESSYKPQIDSVNSVQWLAMRQRFFTTGIYSATPFKMVNMTLKNTDEPNSLKTVNLGITLNNFNVSSNSNTNGLFKYYFGPNDYDILKTFTPDFEKNIYLGIPIVRSFNKYITIPMMDFFNRHIANVGVIIILMVLIIRLLLLPLVIKSYVASAEMKLIAPLLTAIKEKYADNPQTMQIEQIKLFREMGIKPLSGLLPILLQLPILIAMFTYIPNAYIFRGKSFLWATNMAEYDSILNLSFNIPLYGNHVSLLAILMTLSTLLYNYVNKIEGQNNVILMYVMPVIFLLLMNRFSAALSFYYLIFNIVSIIQQIFFKRFINNDKIAQYIAKKKNLIKH